MKGYNMRKVNLWESYVVIKSTRNKNIEVERIDKRPASYCCS